MLKHIVLREKENHSRAERNRMIHDSTYWRVMKKVCISALLAMFLPFTLAFAFTMPNGTLPANKLPKAGLNHRPVPHAPHIGCADLTIKNFMISNVHQNHSDRSYGMAFRGEIWNVGNADYVSPSASQSPRIRVTVQGMARPVLEGRVLVAGKLAQHRVATFVGSLSGAEGTALTSARELRAQLMMPTPSGECNPRNNTARIYQQTVQAAMGSPNNIPPRPEIKRYSPSTVPAGGRVTVHGRFLSHRSNNGTLYLRLAPASRCDYHASSIGVGVNGYRSTNDEFVQIRIPADTTPGRYCIAARWDWQPLRGHGRVPSTTYLKGPANLVVRSASYRQPGNVSVPVHPASSSGYRQPGNVTVQVHAASSSGTAGSGRVCANLNPVSFLIRTKSRVPDAAIGTGHRVAAYRLSLRGVVENSGDTYRGTIGRVVLKRSSGSSHTTILTKLVNNLNHGQRKTIDFITRPISIVEPNMPQYTLSVENTQRGDTACNQLHSQRHPERTISRGAVRSALN